MRKEKYQSYFFSQLIIDNLLRTGLLRILWHSKILFKFLSPPGFLIVHELFDVSQVFIGARSR